MASWRARGRLLIGGVQLTKDMSLETSVEGMVVDASVKTAKQVEQGVERVIRKVWSVMDAAAEKLPPSSFLSESAVRSIQGK